MLLSVLFSILPAGSPAQETWELSCRIETPKLAHVTHRLHPDDPGSPIIYRWSYAYAVARFTNEGTGTAPLAITAVVQPMKEGVVGGRSRAILSASESIVATIREAEGEAELVDFYDLPSSLAKDESANAILLLGRQLQTVDPAGNPHEEFSFPAEFDLLLKGLRYQVEEQEGRRVAKPLTAKAGCTYDAGEFSGAGELEWVEAEDTETLDLGPAATAWAPELADAFSDSWALDVEVQRPRAIYVTEPARGLTDMRSLEDRTRVFWYVRLRVLNRTEKMRPLNLTLRVLARQVFDESVIAEMNDPTTDPDKKEFLAQVVHQVEHVPMHHDDALRAAAAQEVGRFGAIYGPVSYFSLPNRIEPFVGGMEAEVEMLATEPKGAYDVIALFTDDLDPNVAEFEIRIGGTRNEIDWLKPTTGQPEGNFPERRLYFVPEELAVRFRRYGNDEILRDSFRKIDRRWVRLPGASGGVRRVEPFTEVKVGDGEGGG